MKTQTRQFRIHQKLLFDVIQRQAGSLSKAILEIVMNAIDAKASTVDIRLNKEVLTAKDDGQGFGTREQIETFFEVFGQPHEEAEKIFGTFRMGRGQAFSFGRNTWRSGCWKMDVDIQNRGLDYELTEQSEVEVGCAIQIDLYAPLGHAQVADVGRDIQKWCRYAPISVLFNGRCVSVDPAKEKWDHTTEQAYVRLERSGSLSVYNLGIHVCEIGNYRYGTGGEVVSRLPLKVNFARNDIQSDCSVWRKIRGMLDQWTTGRNTKSRSLDDAARQRLADQLRRGEIDPQTVEDKGLFTAVTGRHLSAHDILWPRGYSCYSGPAARGDRVGDMLMRRGAALIFAAEALTRFEFKTVPKLLAWVRKTFATGGDDNRAADLPFVPFEQLAASFTANHTVLGEKELTPTEKLWLTLLERTADRLSVDDQSVYGYRGRKLVIGLSDSAQGWTDGHSFVAIGRDFLKTTKPDIAGLVSVGTLLLHEACHDAPDIEGHDHDQAFFERYHDATMTLGDFVAACARALPALGERLSRKVLAAVDTAEAAETAARKIEQTTTDQRARSIPGT